MDNLFNPFAQQAAAASSQLQASNAAQASIAQTAQDSLSARTAFNEALTQVDADKAVTDGESNIAQGDLNHIDQMTQSMAR